MQPFPNMRAIAHVVLPGLQAELHFSGETFEMEDQRNLTDASYKTFCTPLRLPLPAQTRSGTRIGPSGTLSCLTTVARAIWGSARRRTGGHRGSDVPSSRQPSREVGAPSATGPGHRQPRAAVKRARAGAVARAATRAPARRSASGERGLGRAAAAGEPAGETRWACRWKSPSRLRRTAEGLAALEERVYRRSRPRWPPGWSIQAGEISAAERPGSRSRASGSPDNPGALICSGTNADFIELHRARPPSNPWTWWPTRSTHRCTRSTTRRWSKRWKRRPQRSPAPGD